MGNKLSIRIGDVYIFQKGAHETLTLTASKISRLQDAYYNETRTTGDLHPGDAVYKVTFVISSELLYRTVSHPTSSICGNNSGINSVTDLTKLCSNCM